MNKILFGFLVILIVGISVKFLYDYSGQINKFIDYQLQEIRRFQIDEAKQGVAVDRNHFYAISDKKIAKCEKENGQVIVTWKSPKSSPIKHLNGGLIHNGQLICTHNPEGSNAIILFESKNLKLKRIQPLPHLKGSLTWISPRINSKGEVIWWGALAFYGKEVNQTRVVKFDQNWKIIKSWSFPKQVTQRFYPNSNSGGTWGPNNLLYCTGHDKAEVYVLRVPSKESQLILIQILPVSSTGQGLAWDPELPHLYTINRKKREIIVSKYL